MTSLIDNDDDFFSGLEDDVAANGKFEPARRKTTTEKRYPCGQCNGTGIYRGARVHQPKSHCFACKGQGYFKTDPRKLKEQAQKRRQKKVDERRAFQEQHAELIKWVTGNAHWNNFAASLETQLVEGKLWTDKQLEAAERMRDKCEAKQEEREQTKQEVAATIDLRPIREMFETAFANGHKRPTYRAEGVIINRASDLGRNPGALYIKNESAVYGGKVIETTFHPSREGQAHDYARVKEADGEVRLMPALTALQNIAKNPLEAAIRYGQRTGTCACCGRKLTNKISIELGIGPICRDKWGL